MEYVFDSIMVILARGRRPATITGLLLILGPTLWNIVGRMLLGEAQLTGWTLILPIGLGMACILFGIVATTFSPVSPEKPFALAAPVQGRWMALNSPTSKVPSHGTHGYGQTFAVDLVMFPKPEAAGSAEPRRSGFTHPSAFPSFGQPLFAPAPATVVRVYDRARDHRSRTSNWALLYLHLESIVRDFMGTKRILGNHVVLHLADGTYFVFAHLRKGSSRVAIGQSVSLGEVIGECGNSGNSSEPHLHCQRQDTVSPAKAVGLPWNIQPNGIPENFQFLAESEPPLSGSEPPRS